jgi:uncharacterized membrane protein YgcG
MKKRLLTVLVAVLLLLTTGALAEPNHIYDNALLFSEKDVIAIDAAIAQLQEDTQLDFAILTTDDYLGDDNGIAIGQCFYDSQGYGLDEVKSGVLFYIDMSQKKQYIVTMGYIETLVNDDMLGSVMDAMTPYLADENYKDGILQLIQYVSDTYKAYSELTLSSETATDTETPAP